MATGLGPDGKAAASRSLSCSAASCGELGGEGVAIEDNVIDVHEWSWNSLESRYWHWRLDRLGIEHMMVCECECECVYSSGRSSRL